MPKAEVIVVGAKSAGYSFLANTLGGNTQKNGVASRRVGQLQCSLCGAGGGGGGGFAVAGDLHRWEREFDAIGVERLFDQWQAPAVG